MTEIQPSSPAETRPVLIADADQDNARHVERQLRRAGAKNPIVVIEDGDDLLALVVNCAQNDDPKPCVLFLDPHMPGANGYDPVRWVKREKCLSDLKVVIFSSDETPEEIETARDLGVSLFVKKLPDLGSLAEIVDYASGAPPKEASLAAELPTVPIQ
jgi:CheY-like chemotaxis protein